VKSINDYVAGYFHILPHAFQAHAMHVLNSDSLWYRPLVSPSI